MYCTFKTTHNHVIFLRQKKYTIKSTKKKYGNIYKYQSFFNYTNRIVSTLNVIHEQNANILHRSNLTSNISSTDQLERLILFAFSSLSHLGRSMRVAIRNNRTHSKSFIAKDLSHKFISQIGHNNQLQYKTSVKPKRKAAKRKHTFHVTHNSKLSFILIQSRLEMIHYKSTTIPVNSSLSSTFRRLKTSFKVILWRVSLIRLQIEYSNSFEPHSQHIFFFYVCRHIST